jgi:hypothetical protein
VLSSCARLADQHPHFFSFRLFLAMVAVCVAAAWMAAAYVTAATTHLVSMEVIEGLISTSRKWTMVAVMWIEVVINIAVEVVGAVEPWAGSDEDTAAKPLGAVLPVWSAVVRGVVEVAIRTSRRCSDIDRDLGWCKAWDAQQGCNGDWNGKKFPIVHNFLLEHVS